MSETCGATGIIFRKTEGSYDYDWHNAPARQFVIILNGMVDITVSTGETRRFADGDIILAEDTEGRGHKSRNVNKQPRTSIFITL